MKHSKIFTLNSSALLDTRNTLLFPKEGGKQPENVTTTPLKTVFSYLFLPMAFKVKTNKDYSRVPSTGFYRKN